MNFISQASAEDVTFDTFLTKFNYETRADMKIDSKKLITLLSEKKAVLVDIRFPEEMDRRNDSKPCHPLNIS